MDQTPLPCSNWVAGNHSLSSLVDCWARMVVSALMVSLEWSVD